MAETKKPEVAQKAKKTYSLDDIKFNKDKQVLAALSVLWLIGLVIFFVEQDDNFVRYHAAQYIILGILAFIVGLIPIIGWAFAFFLVLVELVFIVIGLVKILRGERFDMPVISEWALKLMSSI